MILSKNNYVYTRWLFLTIISIVGLMVGACSHGEIQLSEAEPTVTIEKTNTLNIIGHWYTEGKREDLVRNFVRDYGLKNQNVNINLKFPEEVFYNREDLQSNQKFVAKVLRQEKPEWDIVRINGEYQEIMVQMGDPDWPRKYLVDFSQIEEFRNGTIPELLTDEAKKAWNGIIPGPYIEGQFWALWLYGAIKKLHRS